MRALVLALITTTVAISAHAEFRNKARVLLGGSNGSAKKAEALYKLLKDVDGIDKNYDGEDDLKEATLHGLRHQDKDSDIQVRMKYHSPWTNSDDKAIKEVYKYLADDLELGKSFSVDSVYCSKSKDSFDPGYFCDVEFKAER